MTRCLPGLPRASRVYRRHRWARSTSPRLATSRCRPSSRRCGRHWRPSHSTIQTGCSRSSGTATACKPWCPMVGRSCGPETSRTPAATFPISSARRHGSMLATPSSTERWWRSMTRAAPSSACSRIAPGSAPVAQPVRNDRVHRRRSCTRPSTCCTLTAALCWASPSRTASGSFAAGYASIRWSHMPAMSRSMVWHFSKPRNARSWRGLWPSYAAPPMSRAHVVTPG